MVWSGSMVCAHVRRCLMQARPQHGRSHWKARARLGIQVCKSSKRGRMNEMKKLSELAALQRLSAALLAGVLLFAASAQAQPRLTLTTHVPPAVVNGQAALVGEMPGTQRMSLAVSLPLRNEADLDDLLQQL